MARPKEFTEERINQLVKQLYEYIEENDIPIAAEFAYKNKIRRQTLYEHNQFADAMDFLISKKQANLEKGGLLRTIDTTMAKFSLYQLGWREHNNVDVKAGITINLNGKEAPL